MKSNFDYTINFIRVESSAIIHTKVYKTGDSSFTNVSYCGVGCSPICVLCKRPKLPIGHFANMFNAGTLCTPESCIGWAQDPTPCDLWPHELRPFYPDKYNNNTQTERDAILAEIYNRISLENIYTSHGDAVRSALRRLAKWIQERNQGD